MIFSLIIEFILWFSIIDLMGLFIFWLGFVNGYINRLLVSCLFGILFVIILLLYIKNFYFLLKILDNWKII